MKSAHAWAAHLCNGIVIGGFFAFAVLTFDALPDAFPMHYALDGKPDRWVEKTWGSWLMLPVVSVGLTAFLYGIAVFVSAWGPRHPRWINVPAKKVYLRLPPEDQVRIIRSSIWALAWVAVPMNTLMFYCQWIGLQVAHKQREGLGLPFWLLILLVVPGFALLPVFGVRKLVLDAAEARGIDPRRLAP